MRRSVGFDTDQAWRQLLEVGQDGRRLKGRMSKDVAHKTDRALWYFGHACELTFVDKAPTASNFVRATATLLACASVAPSTGVGSLMFERVYMARCCRKRAAEWNSRAETAVTFSDRSAVSANAV